MELNQLVLCKQLYNEAEGYLSRKESVAFGLAVSISQDAVELFLRAVIKQLPSNGQKPPDEFIKCMDYIDAAASGEDGRRVPFRARMSELNKARVNFKHYGLVPSELDAVRLVGYAEQFFEIATPPFFDCTFSDITLSDLVTSKDVRERLKIAEREQEAGNVDEALGAAAEAVELAATALLNLLQPFRNRSIPGELRSALGIGARNFEVYLGSEFDRTNRMALDLALNLNVNDLSKFRRMVPYLHNLIDKRFARHYRRGPGLCSIDDAEFVVSFATRYALAVDARMPTDSSAWPQEGEDPLVSLE